MIDLSVLLHSSRKGNFIEGWKTPDPMNNLLVTSERWKTVFFPSFLPSFLPFHPSLFLFSFIFLPTCVRSCPSLSTHGDKQRILFPFSTRHSRLARRKHLQIENNIVYVSLTPWTSLYCFILPPWENIILLAFWFLLINYWMRIYIHRNTSTPWNNLLNMSKITNKYRGYYSPELGLALFTQDFLEATSRCNQLFPRIGILIKIWLAVWSSIKSQLNPRHVPVIYILEAERAITISRTFHDRQSQNELPFSRLKLLIELASVRVLPVGWLLTNSLLLEIICRL